MGISFAMQELVVFSYWKSALTVYQTAPKTLQMLHSSFLRSLFNF